ncbi:MAG: DUF6807 family protein, partial [Verrucomicrobiales bacterium]
GDIVHQEFLGQDIEDGVATFTSLNHWMDEKGEAFLAEERQFQIRELDEKGRLQIDMQSKFTPLRGDVYLKGDPEHAGVQFRPANEVERKKTKYIYPDGILKIKGKKDLPWVAENFTLAGQEHGVLILNDPENPKNTVYSAYRDYGRFGAFFEKEIKQGESLEVHYGFRIFAGPLPEAKELQELWKAWSGN